MRFSSVPFTRTCVLALVAFVAAASAAPATGETLKLGGTGTATELLKRLGAVFKADSGVEVVVVPSLGSSGAIRAVIDGALDLAVTGRALKPEEAARGLTVAFTARTPFVLATSHPNPDGLALADIANAFQSERATWSDGSPIRVILRPRAESDTTLMGELFPGVASAIAIARLRPDIPALAPTRGRYRPGQRRHGRANAGLARRIDVDAARAGRRNLRVVPIEGVAPTFENFERGLYRYAAAELHRAGATGAARRALPRVPALSRGPARAARKPSPAGAGQVAVNLSAVQFNANNLVELVFSALSASRLAASRLELEITESALLDNSEFAFAILKRLRDMGVRISLDDFGIGYSCLSYLRRFPFDKIKIDRSFIRDMGSDQQSVAIIQAVIGLGASLDMATVAEGVESRDELDCLRAFGCTEVQGYYISPPRPAGEVALMLADHSRQDRARRLSRRMTPPRHRARRASGRPPLLPNDYFSY